MLAWCRYCWANYYGLYYIGFSSLTCNVMALKMGQAGFWQQRSRSWWKIHSPSTHEIINQFSLDIYTRLLQQHHGNERWGGLFICGLGQSFFAYSNPKLSYLQAVLPKHVDKYLSCDENSDFCFIISLWQLRYLWKLLNIMQFIASMQALLTAGSQDSESQIFFFFFFFS